MPARFHLGIDQLLTILQSLAVLLFVAGGAPLVARRARWRRAAIATYLAALAVALVYVGLWLTSR